MVVFNMATAFSPSGHHSPTALSRTIEKVFDEAQHTGHINLTGRKLRDYPKLASKYDLSDTSHADLSKNRYSEIPTEVCDYTSMEDLSCYHNVIRCIPEAIVQLQSLVHLNLSRNQLSNVPPFICQLQSLEVLRASNNKLVSLPEEIGRLERLMDLDVSCNEITHLPIQIGDLESLKTLNIRKNLLVELPEEISKLSLQTLDCSSNKISTIPTSFRKIETLQELILDHNPLVSPPAHICTKGRVHIMKYLIMEAIKEDRKRGVLISEADHHHMRRHFRKSSSLQNSDELKQIATIGGDSPVDRRKRNAYVGSDSGYNTTDSTEKSRWSPPEVNNEVDELNNLAVKAAETVKEQRQEREMELQRRIIATATHDPVTTNGGSPSGGGGGTNNETESFLDITPPGQSPIIIQDEFTRELNRQKSEYEAKKRRAEQLRLEKEEEEEKERRRRAVLKLQEEQQKVMMDRQREESSRRAKTNDNNNYNNTSPPSTANTNQLDNDFTGYNNIQPSPITVRKPVIHTSQSFKEEKKMYQNNNTYRRTVSETNQFYSANTTTALNREPEPYYRNNGVNSTSAESSPSVNRRTPQPQQPSQQTTNQEAEFRLRHEAMIQQQRQEAQNVMRRIEEEKKRMKQMQKDAVHCFNNKQQSLQEGSRNSMQSNREQTDGYNHYNGENVNNQPYNKHPTPKPKSSHAFSIGTQKRLEELASHNPNFTIRRQLEHAREELEKIEQLRMSIESRLKVTLPDDLPQALRDGVVLCHLANHVRPRSVSSIHVPSPAVPKLSMAKCRRNVENFLEACRKIGVDSENICACDDILDDFEATRVANTVQLVLQTPAVPPSNLHTLSVFSSLHRRFSNPQTNLSDEVTSLVVRCSCCRDITETDRVVANLCILLFCAVCFLLYLFPLPE